MKPTNFDLHTIEIVSAIRKITKEKQSTFAALLQITQPEYCRIEKGERAISVGHLKSICDSIGLPLQELVRVAEELKDSHYPESNGRPAASTDEKSAAVRTRTASDELVTRLSALL